MADYSRGIVIEFDGNLTGEIISNVNAFTISSDEQIHINGDLVNKDYLIDSVDYYALQENISIPLNINQSIGIAVDGQVIKLEEVV